MTLEHSFKLMVLLTSRPWADGNSFAGGWWRSLCPQHGIVGSYHQMSRKPFETSMRRMSDCISGGRPGSGFERYCNECVRSSEARKATFQNEVVLQRAG